MPSKISRRQWSKLALMGVTGLSAPALLYGGKYSLLFHSRAEPAKPEFVLGVQTSSFRDRSLDDAIAAMKQLGIKSCELWQGHVEPREFQWRPKMTKEDQRNNQQGLKEWRKHVSMKDIEAVRKKLGNAGIKIQAYSNGIRKGLSDDEMDLIFNIVKTLGTDTLTTSATVDVMDRVDFFAKKYRINVGMHNHSHTEDPNEFSSPESFARAMAGRSEFIKINLDIGHFTAANFDAVDFIRKNHSKIVCIHIKDRERNQGSNLPFGEGETPIVEVLQLIQKNQWLIPGNIEYEYKGQDAVAEVAKCMAYCKMALQMYNRAKE